MHNRLVIKSVANLKDKKARTEDQAKAESQKKINYSKRQENNLAKNAV